MVVGDATKARFISTFIDNLLAFVLMLIAVGLVPERFLAARGVGIFVGFLGYFFVLEGLSGRTAGKWFQGLVVRKLDGSRAGWKEAAIRTLLRVFEVNPALFGGLPAGLILISTERKQRLGDILAGTIVVSDKISWDNDALDKSSAD